MALTSGLGLLVPGCLSSNGSAAGVHRSPGRVVFRPIFVIIYIVCVYASCLSEPVSCGCMSVWMHCEIEITAYSCVKKLIW